MLLTQRQIQTINIARSAIPGRIYHGTDGKTYQGLANRTLLEYQPAVTSSFIPTPTNKEVTVQKAIENISNIVINNSTDITAQEDIVAFAGGGIAGATILNWTLNYVDTVASNGDSVKLPLNSANPLKWVYNNDVNDCSIYPWPGTQFMVYNSLYGINTPIPLSGGSSRQFVLINGIWRTL